MCTLCVCLCTRVPADTADKALGVVRASQSRDHLSCDEAVTAVTACTVQALIVGRTNVLALLLEEARSSQITVTHCGERKSEKKYSAKQLRNKMWMRATRDVNNSRGTCLAFLKKKAHEVSIFLKSN